MKSVEAGSTAIPKIMVFRPSLEEMKDFSKYLEYMESKGAHKAGLAKIIPPAEWVPRKSGYDNINIMIKSPIQQLVTGGQGLYQQFNIQKRSMSFKEFKRLSNSPKYCTPEFFDYEDLERKYWKNITYNSPIYGADVPGTLTDSDCKEFNINNLNTILDLINESYGVKIMGVNTAYLYFGMWKSTFAWHTEDMDLYSINYLHFGAPKSWYCVPPEHGKRLERLANGFFNELYQTCPAFLRHKMTLISPHMLKKYSIPFNKITQESGEFMITFPYSYHAGYNHGLNCAESTNFALPRWIEFGKRATRCLCRSDTVKISMDVFVKRFQPERYENWLKGKDIGPDPKDPLHICAAPSPYALEEEAYNKVTKPKRQPAHKRQLVQTTNNISLECIDDCEIEESSDLEINISQNVREKKNKSKKKKIKVNSPLKKDIFDNSLNNNELNPEINLNNTTSSDNNSFDNSLHLTNGQNESENCDDGKQTSVFFLNGTSNSNLSLEVTSLEELSRRTLQYTENPKAFEDEVKLNFYTSFIKPYCAICSVLTPFELDKTIDSFFLSNWRSPTSSSILIPKSVFLSKIKQVTYINNTENESWLLNCSTCKICVHSVCYGVSDFDVNRDNWKCDRCLAQDVQAACCLCPLRGGPLKKTTCNQWVHLTCALIMPNVKIETDRDMQPVDISQVQLYRSSDRMVCTFCNKKANFSYISNYIMGYCLRCNMSNNCNSYFHITCAYREGVVFEVNEQSSSFRLTCKKCKKTKVTKVRDLSDLNLGSTVIAKYNSYYSYGSVIDKHEELFHHIQFVDNTIVDNIKSQDILNRDCEIEKPLVGDPIEVIWNKEQLHGKYSGCHTSQMYTVLFDNSAQQAVKREDIYLLNEDLPKRVQIKFLDSLKFLD